MTSEGGVVMLGSWFVREIVNTDRLPMFCLLCSFIVTFAFIRASVRMIRAQVRWWPGNVQPGGLHIHHVVFGVVLMMIGGVSAIAVHHPSTPVKSVLAAVFGIGAALVLDEFALILHLRDVYWQEAGRASVDAVFVAVAMIGLVLLGFKPIGFIDWSDYRADPSLANALWIGGYALVMFAFAAVTLLKGKVWTGLLGLFFNVLLVIGALRLSRPHAPWSRWRYQHKPRKLARATRREERWRTPVIGAKVRVQEFVSGRFDEPGAHPERELAQGPKPEPEPEPEPEPPPEPEPEAPSGPGEPNGPGPQAGSDAPAGPDVRSRESRSREMDS